MKNKKECPRCNSREKNPLKIIDTYKVLICEKCNLKYAREVNT